MEIHPHREINGNPEVVDATLEEISKELKAGETLVLDVEDSSDEEVDMIYDMLIMKGYVVQKSRNKGRAQILVNRKINGF